MINCPICKNKSRVVQTIGDYRMRLCTSCNYKFLTREFVQNSTADRAKFNDKKHPK